MRIQKALHICFVAIACGLIVCCVWLLSLVGGADNTTYPWKKADLWVCKDPHFEIDFTGDRSASYIEWKDDKYYVDIGLHADSFDVFLQSDDQVLREENILLRGTWKYINSSMVVEVLVDKLFGGAYTELVFNPQ